MQARNEVRVLASLNHPNVVKYYETFVDEKSGKLQIVMEYCEVSLDLSTQVTKLICQLGEPNCQGPLPLNVHCLDANGSRSVFNAVCIPFGAKD